MLRWLWDHYNWAWKRRERKYALGNIKERVARSESDKFTISPDEFPLDTMWMPLIGPEARHPTHDSCVVARVISEDGWRSGSDGWGCDFHAGIGFTTERGSVIPSALSYESDARKIGYKVIHGHYWVTHWRYPEIVLQKRRADQRVKDMMDSYVRVPVWIEK